MGCSCPRNLDYRTSSIDDQLIEEGVGHTPVPPFNSLCLHIVLVGKPAAHGKSSLSSLILEILGEDDTGFLVGNIIGLVISILQVLIVAVPLLIERGEIAVVGVMGLQVIVLGLFLN